MELTPELREKLREAKKVLKRCTKNELITHSINLSMEVARLKLMLEGSPNPPEEEE